MECIWPMLPYPTAVLNRARFAPHVNLAPLPYRAESTDTISSNINRALGEHFRLLSGLSSGKFSPTYQEPNPKSDRFKPYLIDKKMFKCPSCQYLTDRKNNLKRHIATMHEKCTKPLECCDVQFANKATLRDHVISHHRNGYQCKVCGRNFCRKALLKRHVTVHSGQKDFICDICGYATSHKSNLERHKRRHQQYIGGQFGDLGEWFGKEDASEENDRHSSINSDDVGQAYPDDLSDDVEMDETIPDDIKYGSQYVNQPSPSSSLSSYSEGSISNENDYTHKKYRYKNMLLSDRINCTYTNSSDESEAELERKPPMNLVESARIERKNQPALPASKRRLCLTSYGCSKCLASFHNQIQLVRHSTSCNVADNTMNSYPKPLLS